MRLRPTTASLNPQSPGSYSGRFIATAQDAQWRALPAMVGNALREARGAEADPLGCPGEIAAPGDEDRFVVAQFERGGEVDRVVAAKLEAA